MTPAPASYDANGVSQDGVGGAAMRVETCAHDEGMFDLMKRLAIISNRIDAKLSARIEVAAAVGASVERCDGRFQPAQGRRKDEGMRHRIRGDRIALRVSRAIEDAARRSLETPVRRMRSLAGEGAT